MNYFRFEVFSAQLCLKNQKNQQYNGPDFFSGVVVYCTNNTSYYDFNVAKNGCLNALKGNLKYLASLNPAPTYEMKHVKKLINRLTALHKSTVEIYCKRNNTSEMQI